MRVHKNEKGRARVYCSGRAQGAGCTCLGTFLEIYEGQIEAYLQNFAIPEDYQSRILEAYDRLTVGYGHSTRSPARALWALRRHLCGRWVHEQPAEPNQVVGGGYQIPCQARTVHSPIAGPPESACL